MAVHTRCHTPSGRSSPSQCRDGRGHPAPAGAIPFGVITRSGLGHLSEYRVVLLPDVLRMDEEELRAFRAYVEGRGDTFTVVGVRHC